MSLRPTEKSILESYSLDELLSLVQEKVQRDIESGLEGLRITMNRLMGSWPGSGALEKTERQETAAPPAPVQPKRGRGRPRRLPLGDMLSEVLGDQPMGIEEILEKLVQRGFQSKSKDPRRILYIELGKQVGKGTVQKAGRGKYCRG